MITLPYPKTIRAEQAYQYFGVRRDQLRKWAFAGLLTVYGDDKANYFEFSEIDDLVHSKVKSPRIREMIAGKEKKPEVAG